MSSGGQGRVLRHGTTRKRAEAIFRDGPDPDFLEPGGFDKAEGFSTVPAGKSCAVGVPERYARGKASNFPNEGGPAILEIEVSQEIIDLADHNGGDVRFWPGMGLEELLDAWPTLPKRILTC